MTATIGILNVGAGDTKLTFDKNNPADCIRAARIVKDMIRRGYALLVDVGDGKYQRAIDFKEDVYEYVIADFDPLTAAKHDKLEKEDGEGIQSKNAAPPSGEAPKKRGRPKLKNISATRANGIAVARTAGG